MSSPSTIEFEGAISKEGQISVPLELVDRIPADGRVHVYLAWIESELDASWREAGRRVFEQSFYEEDSICDHLIAGDAVRLV